MPNGYTAAIYDGQPVSVRDYLMGVGRGMGFAIMQRDDSHDEPVHHVEPHTDYHDSELAKARTLLAEVDTMTTEQAAKRARSEHEEALRDWTETRERRRSLRARYEEMITEVEAWEPDPLVVGVKEAAAKYLRESMDFDCGDPKDDMRWYPYPTLLSGPEWINAKRAEATRDIEYHEAQRCEEIDRANERNRYIAAFLSSLPSSPSPVSPSGESRTPCADGPRTPPVPGCAGPSLQETEQ